jgi:hypothetical protein
MLRILCFDTVVSFSTENAQSHKNSVRYAGIPLEWDIIPGMGPSTHC